MRKDVIDTMNESIGKGLENLTQPISNILSSTQSLLSSFKLFPQRFDELKSSVVSTSEGTNKLIKSQTESIKYQRISLNTLVTKVSSLFRSWFCY